MWNFATHLQNTPGIMLGCEAWLKIKPSLNLGVCFQGIIRWGLAGGTCSACKFCFMQAVAAWHCMFVWHHSSTSKRVSHKQFPTMCQGSTMAAHQQCLLLLHQQEQPVVTH